MVAQMKKQPMWADMEKMAHTLAYDGAIMRVTQQGDTLRTDRWVSVTTPTLVIDGDRSDAFLRGAADAIAKALPHAQHKTLAGQDHSAVYSSPQAIAPVLVEFFKR
jgi:pimeloyl-ACP methyl ester carboxylesterase